MKKLFRRIKKYKLWLILTGFTIGCANVGELTGGQTDSEPPLVVKTSPENRSVGFTDRKIILEFNEYVRLNSATQKLMVSPPLKQQPEIKVRGKSVVITINDTLKSDMTYNFDFGDGIADNTEGNPLTDFNYVFSTGTRIDSMQIAGKVEDAFSKKPSADILVMLYKSNQEIDFLKSKPDYVCRTNKEGLFRVKNINDGEYKIFALNDANSNMLFDQPAEEIAFLDSMLITSVTSEIKTDTLHNDSTGIDSLVTRRMIKYSPDNITLNLFAEDNLKQFISKEERKQPYRLDLLMNKPLKGKANFEFRGISTSIEDYMVEEYKVKDSVTIWITDSTIYKEDSIYLLVTIPDVDSLEKTIQIKDTLLFSYKKPIDKRKKDEKNNTKVLLAEAVTKGGILHPKRDFIVSFGTPIMSFNKKAIHLFMRQDTSKIEIPFDMKRDTFYLRKYHISAKWEEGSEYTILLDSGAVKDYYGMACDSTVFSFSTYTADKYGSLIMTLKKVKSPLVVQLLNSKGDIQRETVTLKDKKLKFNGLMPGEYRVRVIYDNNKNRKWDTGKYIFKRQPEKVQYFEKTISVKENWEIDEDWEL
ncbi:MAG: hypothetical protein A2W91_14195 [Bacteroidetes bacterium GWF2_38_335]|nr:MAG: hypothetical protein A2W91_14195 [Bacteroidetes bacterium GWF2_38_335]OFY79386.1 MAG: hypothetical protein A2281_16960 [Bacteroidetes bacterium RIFOXYA12_FULL_38_20]HBS85650.1 hypothetical protein [Bacteroidales bacterium]